jgi:hypothetical protein
MALAPRAGPRQFSVALILPILAILPSCFLAFAITALKRRIARIGRENSKPQNNADHTDQHRERSVRHERLYRLT